MLFDTILYMYIKRCYRNSCKQYYIMYYMHTTCNYQSIRGVAREIGAPEYQRKVAPKKQLKLTSLLLICMQY